MPRILLKMNNHRNQTSVDTLNSYYRFLTVSRKHTQDWIQFVEGKRNQIMCNSTEKLLLMNRILISFLTLLQFR